MQLPPPRVREVLSVLGDLKPAEARALLSEVVATLDAAELRALRVSLPPQAMKFLPHCVGAVTVMNTEPMPWEFVAPAPVEVAVQPGPTTSELIAATLGPSPRRPWVVAAGAVVVTALTVFLAWPSSVAPAPITAVAVPPPPAQEYAPLPTVAPAEPKPVRASRKTVSAKPAARSEPPARKLGPNEWASPFDRRH